MKKKISRINASILSFVLAAAMVMGLSGMTALAADPEPETQTIIVKEWGDGNTPEGAVYPYHLCQVTKAFYPIDSMDDIVTYEPGAGLSYTVYDSYTDEEIDTGTTDEEGGFSLQVDQYAEFTVEADTTWYVNQDDPEDSPLLRVTADGRHATVVDEYNGVVQYTPDYDKSKLQKEYDNDLLLDESDYTEASWAPFAEVLEKAKEVLDDESATQDEIDQALEDLENAREGLEKAESEPEPTPTPTPTASVTISTGLDENAKTYDGESVTLTATAKDLPENAEVSYQWYKDGTAIEGATESTYTVPGDVSDSGTYKCVVTVKEGTEETTVEGEVELTITKAEQGLSFESASLTKYDYDSPFTNVLTKTDVVGAITYKSSDESVAAVDPSTGEVTIHGTGEVTITATAAGDGNHTEATASFVLIVNEDVIHWEFEANQGQITRDEEKGEYVDNLNYNGEPLELTITITLEEGDESEVEAIGYQWYRYNAETQDFDKIDGATQDTYTLEGEDVNAGDYIYMCEVVVTYKSGYTHTVYSSIEINIAKLAQSISYDQTEIAKTTDDEPFTNDLTIETISPEDGAGITYASSDTTVVTVDEKGLVSIVAAGEATITATAAGTTNYAEASASYTLTVTGSAQNPEQPKVSDVKITSGLTDNEKTYDGEGITLTVTADVEPEDAEISYQWYKDGEPIDGATDAKLVLDGDVTDSGTYKCVVTGEKDGVTASVEDSLTITIEQAVQDISYEQTVVSKTNHDVSFINDLTETAVYGKITYSSSDDTVAAVDPETGTVTIKGSGLTTITATAAGSENYTEAEASYFLLVSTDEIAWEVDVNHDRLTWDEENEEWVADLTYNGDPLEFEVVIDLSETEQAEVEAIIYQWYRFDPDTEEFKEIDGATEDIYTLEGDDVNAGEYLYMCVAVVTYNSGYTHMIFSPIEIVIEKAPQEIFYQETEINKTTNNKAFTNPLTEKTVDTDGGAVVIYESSDTNIATVDENGEVTILAAGEVTITASVPETANYEAASASYTLLIEQGDEPWENVQYAVKLWGINRDVDQEGKTLGLTFGPATGASYIDDYEAHLTKAEYEADDEAYCIHWMDWDEIIAQSAKDPTVFFDCLENGCTKAVELTTNRTIFNSTAVENALAQSYTGDGVSTLYYLLNGTGCIYPAQTYGVNWNQKTEGANIDSFANVYSQSRIRVTLNGDQSDAWLPFASSDNGADLCDENDCLLSCFPKELQEAIVPRATENTGNATIGSIANDKTTYDKLWLLSMAEVGLSANSDDSGGTPYGITTSSNSRKAYEFNGRDAETAVSRAWWLRSRFTGQDNQKNYSSAYFITLSGSSSYITASNAQGLSPCFCLAGPEKPTVEVTITATGDIDKNYDGNGISLTANATFTPEEGTKVAYQWYKDGVAIKGATYNLYNVDGNVSDSGTYKCVVTASNSAGEATAEAEVTVEIIPAKQVISYAVETVTMAMEDVSFTNPLAETTVSEEEGAGITYKSSNDKIAQVDEDGKVTFVAPGTVTITATALATANYDEATASYTLTIKEAEAAKVNYAVKIWGIQTDSYSEDGGETFQSAGLTFGPATGANYIGSYESCDSMYCIHNMSWEDIIAQCKEDPTVFENCFQNGCTKAVELTPNKQLFNMTTAQNYADSGYTGDGVSTLDFLLNGTGSSNTSGASWNVTHTGMSASDPANIYSRSQIRTTLTGDSTDIEAQLANGGSNFYYTEKYPLCDESNCLLSCFPEELRDAVVPRTTVNTGNATKDDSANDKTTYDKLFLFSLRETGITAAGDDSGGKDYGVNPSDSSRVTYEFNGESAGTGRARSWRTRSRCIDSVSTSNDYYFTYYVGSDGTSTTSSCTTAEGLSPGFCLEGPEMEEPTVSNVEITSDVEGNSKPYDGEGITLTVTATVVPDTAEMSYQWYKVDENGSETRINGAEDSVYVTGDKFSDSGTYKCVVTATNGGLTASDSGEITVEITETESSVVNYAVKIWGIGVDTYSEDGGKTLETAGLTFGPATGANYTNSYKAHLTEDQYDSGNNGVCIHWMSWDEIIAQSKEDPSVFEKCLEGGCTKAVELTPNETIFNMTTFENYLERNYNGDGVGTLYAILTTDNTQSQTTATYYGALWNKSTSGYSADDPANVYSRSRVRATLIGDSADAKAQVAAGGNDYYGVDTMCDESNCLLSCFPQELQDAVVPRTTVNANSENTSSINDKTTYDKLFLFSVNEVGSSQTADDSGGEAYPAATTYKPSSNPLQAYGVTTYQANSISGQDWLLRSRRSNNYSIYYVQSSSSSTNFMNANATSRSISPAFCLAGPEETEEEATAFAVYSEGDSSLTFYTDTDVPTDGDTYKDKEATRVYTDIESLEASGPADIPWYDKRDVVTSVEIDSSFADAKPINLAGWFYGYANASFTGFENMDTSEVRSMQNTFDGCTSLTELDVSEWDTSNVTNMVGVFANCSALGSLDPSGWDTGNVTTMQQLFSGCSSLTSIGDTSNWNTANVEDMYCLFYTCSSLEEVSAANWNTKKVTDMRFAFSGCSSLTSLDISGWDTSSVTNYSSFATNLGDDFAWIKIGDDFDLFTKSTSRIVSQQYWYDSDINGKEMSSNYMIGVSNATSGNESGQYWTYTEEQDLTAFAVYSEENSSLKFYYGTAPSEGEMYNGEVATAVYTGVDNLTPSKANDLPWFEFNSIVTSVVIDGSFVQAQPESLAYWFYGFKKASISGLENMDTSKVTSMYYTFYNCNAATELEVSGWDTANVTTIHGTFYGCNSITNMDLSNWEVSNVTDIAYLFYSCNALTSVEGLSEWDTSNVTTMIYTFRNCSGLTSLDISEWDTTKVTGYTYFATGLGDDFAWIKIGDKFDLFTKSESALVSQQNWYDSAVNGKVMSENYMIGVSNATSGNESGQYWTHTEAKSATVNYAVKIWGIGVDTYSEDGGATTTNAGLTFGPAFGDNDDGDGTGYINTYKAHVTKDVYEADDEVYCIHWMSWDEIIKQSAKDPSVFADCKASGCTKSVELTPNDTLFNLTMVDSAMQKGYSGDGVSTLLYLLNGTGSSTEKYNYGALWNYSRSGSSGTDPSQIYSKSRIRVTLNGDPSDAELKYASSTSDGSDLCDETNCLLSCFPEDLREAIVPRTVLTSTSAYDKTTYDKLWLASSTEVGAAYSSDNADSVNYGFTSSSYGERIAYEYDESGDVAAALWWSRTWLTAWTYTARMFMPTGTFSEYYVTDVGGLSPCFCLE